MRLGWNACKLKRIKGKYRWDRCPKAVAIYKKYEKTKDIKWQMNITDTSN